MKYMQEDFNNLLSSLPDIEELRRRVLLFTAIDGAWEYRSEADGFYLNYNEKNSDRYFWQDGGGLELNIIFKADGKHEDSIIMLANDNESSFNDYPIDNPDSEFAFQGMPQEFEHILKDSFLKRTWDGTPEDERVVHATIVIWKEHNDPNWKMSPALIQAMETEKEDGGFDYAFNKFAIEPTVENLLAYYEEQDYDPDEDMPDIGKYYNEVYLKK